MSSRATLLRLKLTLWYVLVFAAIQFALLAGIVLLRQDRFADEFDGSLARKAGNMVQNLLVAELDLTGAGDAGMQKLVPADAQFELFAVRDEAGLPLAVSPGVDAARVPFSAHELVEAGAPVPAFRSIDAGRATGVGADLPALRMVTLPFQHVDGRRYYLQAAVRERAWHFGPFRELFLIGMPVGLLAAWAAAWLLGGRAVRPLRRISAAAKGVTIEKLGRPIDVAERDLEVRQLERELNHALERIEAAYRAHERFLSAVSHELNTPVAVLLTEAQTLKGARLDAGESERFVKSVEEEMRRLQTLVQSLLSLSRAESVQERAEVAFEEVVARALEHSAPIASSRAVRLVHSAPAAGESRGARVCGDRWLLETMLDNLLRNAIRFSPVGEAVELGWGAERGELSVRVSDAGPGIPEPWLERVFDPFVQVPRGAERAGGTGLGLTIARRIAEAHGGRIYARNHADRGCTFSVRLPLARAVRAPAAEGASR